MKRFGNTITTMIIKPIMFITPLAANFYFISPMKEVLFDVFIEVLGGVSLYFLMGRNMDPEILDFLVNKNK